MYIIQQRCEPGLDIFVSSQIESIPLMQGVQCVQGLLLWRNSSSVMRKEVASAYQAAYDFLNTKETEFNVHIWYNGSNNGAGNTRILRSVNAVSIQYNDNSYLQFIRGTNVKMLLEYVREMPKLATGTSKLNVSTILGPLFFTWVIELLLPAILVYLVYEKQGNLRIMMKMHGLNDGPYWMISYAYFLVISSVYVLSLVVFGSLIGLRSFTSNNYSVQFVFFFIYINLQIVFAFLSATFFSNVKTATAISYIYVFGSGLLGLFLFERFIQDVTFPRKWLLCMEIVPCFSLYRGLYELGQYSFEVDLIGTDTIGWKDILLNSDNYAMRDVLILMTAEWLILLVVAYYLDQVASYGSGIRKHPLWFLQNRCTKSERSLQRSGYDAIVNSEKPDVSQESEIVEKLLMEPNENYPVICHNLRKVYRGRDGNPDKVAVEGLSLALPRGECFGMLGPNGAGKTSFISMMTGLTTSTSGTAYVQGLDISKDMDEVYTSMGVCPQHDLIWETLSGREHLLFYGRLKNLKGVALENAVKESLKKVNLHDKEVADKLAGAYSGGMKRRLSVAISLIGNPHVVYMDEPSTGLDPASRKSLWKAVQQAKQDRVIILTTHSMEEAEFLCDRVGIFVGGNLQCIGNPKELKARYGGSYMFTMTTPSNQEEEVQLLAHQLSPRAKRVYHISGTQKFQLPKEDVRIPDAFRAVERAKRRLTIHAWGLADTTLEDVFIKVAKEAGPINVLS
ncbi:ABC transporter A family member 7 [Acorus gramineus]|uniref:ABC transporter A family member 7 n=1 Tax=Acorus gramineus TaxID=55184 RepID=A0AAV9A039_ACOGR|nr:ABC transporter A family member 7 [Acorus gramineus]